MFVISLLNLCHRCRVALELYLRIQPLKTTAGCHWLNIYQSLPDLNPRPPPTLTEQSACGEAVSSQGDVFSSSGAELEGCRCEDGHSLPSMLSRAIVLVTSPGERGLVITWFTPTLFTPLSIGSYWTRPIGMKKEKYRLLILDQSLDHLCRQIGPGNFLLPLFVSTSNCVSSLLLVPSLS